MHTKVLIDIRMLLKKRPCLKRVFRVALQLLTQPSCMVGPKLIFSKNAYIDLHRELVLKSYPTRSRWQWVLVFFISVISWYLFSLWRQLFLCSRLFMSVAKNRYNLAISRQWIDLIYLGFWFGVAPSDYYQLRLHQFERNRWLKFVFMQEQQNWQLVHSLQIYATSHKLLSDKYKSEQILRDVGLNCVRTIDLIPKGDRLFETRLFQGQSRFIKPQNANAMRGCMFLDYDPKSNSYSLVGKGMDRKPICESSRSGIVYQLQLVLAHNSLLIQEVLSNSMAMSAFCHNEKLVTLRVISCRINQSIELAYALLEVESDSPESWCIYPLDITNGMILDHPIHGENCLNLAKINQSHAVPQWVELKKHVREAHQHFPDLKTIGWDLCVTESGACIIEGNSGWGLITPQIVSELPLLESKLYEAYTSSRSE